MGIEWRNTADVGVLAVNGKLTILEGEDALWRKIDEALGQGGKRFVLDLSRLDYIDSSMLGECVACLKRCRARDAGLKLVVTPDSAVDKIFRLVALDRLFEMFDDTTDAVTSFADG